MKKKGLIAILLLLILFSIFIYFTFYSPLNSSQGEKVVYIKYGMNFNEVVNLLRKENIIKDNYRIIFAAKLLGLSKKIKAGEYKVSGKWSVRELLLHLTSGKVILHKLEVPEGLTWWQVGKIVASSGLTTFEAFKKYVFNKPILRKLNIYQDSAEGFLFPDTYFFAKRDTDSTAKEIVTSMIKEFWKKCDTILWHGKRPDPKKVLEIVILASLIEKETSIPAERPIIAGVFYNRLKTNMPLQCDPTVIYGIGPAFNGNLTKKDLKDRSNPYNTYIYKGLPPTPICSPGLDSLKAAMHPKKHDFLYFVAKGDGSHVFSKTLKEHNMAVRKYILKK